MKISELGSREIANRLRLGELLVRIGPFVARMKSDVATLAADLDHIYADFGVEAPDVFADFHVEVAREAGLRRWFKPQVRFFFDGRPSFIPLPAAQAFAMLEWGLNWCVAAHCHQFLIIHAAVVEREGRAAILAAPPGSGKSTLCAGLVNRGWRLFSDELALIDTATGELVAFPRPICLKNTSIEVIKTFAPEARFGPMVRETRKGNVAHMRPPQQDIRLAATRARPAWIVLPRFEAGATTRLRPMAKARAGWSLASNAFNFSVLGDAGFATLSQAVDGCTGYDLDYGDLDAATALLARLAESA